MQTTPNNSSGPGDTTRLRTPFLPPIPARWMIHNDGSLRTASSRKPTNDPNVTQSLSLTNSSHPPNASLDFS